MTDIHSSLWRCQREVDITFLKLFFSIKSLPSLNKQTSKQTTSIIHSYPQCKTLSVHCILYTCYFTDQSFCLTSLPWAPQSAPSWVRHFAYFYFCPFYFWCFVFKTVLSAFLSLKLSVTVTPWEEESLSLGIFHCAQFQGGGAVPGWWLPALWQY